MHNYPYNNAVGDYNLKFHEMISMYSKYSNMYKNELFYALIFINNYIITSVNCMLSLLKFLYGGNLLDFGKKN